MRALLIVVLVISVIGALIHAVYLIGEYPRHRSPATTGMDALDLIINMFLIAWTSYLLLA